MTDKRFDEIEKMRRKLSSNQRSPDFLLKLGEIYHELNVGSAVDFSVDEGVVITKIVDWHSHHSAIRYSLESFKLHPTIDSALLILNSFNFIGNYSASVEFITQQNLMEKFPNEKLAIVSVLFHSLMKKGLLTQSVKLLYEISPEYFEEAQENLNQAEETVQQNFQRTVSRHSATIFSKGESEEGFLEFCEQLLDTYQRERNVQDYLAANINWDYEYCFRRGVESHKEGFIRLALHMYALAFFLKPTGNTPEFYSLAALHLLGEHQIAFERTNQFIDKYPKNVFAYIVAGNSCAILGNLSGLELILTKAHSNKIKTPLIDLQIGYYLESKGQIRQAQNYYEKCAKESNNEMFSNIFNSRLERTKHE